MIFLPGRKPSNGYGLDGLRRVSGFLFQFYRGTVLLSETSEQSRKVWGFGFDLLQEIKLALSLSLYNTENQKVYVYYEHKHWLGGDVVQLKLC